ncbi:hypothetical protein BpHYR1_019385 [Brachionus plicatilis]|uniref:Uncharacterized protein n=1 Tax=Brachionus plicatilis TaxID=10195 RepID=A0A3M7SJT5_BRAPC|nr:hypothetical protein BpHYR1_019385 [Brachionus plicatilis]
MSLSCLEVEILYNKGKINSNNIKFGTVDSLSTSTETVTISKIRNYNNNVVKQKYFYWNEIWKSNQEITEILACKVSEELFQGGQRNLETLVKFNTVYRLDVLLLLLII